MVTIIIPVYNSSHTIDACIASVLKQDYKDWKLVLVDDGSTDSSYSKCLKYAGHDVRINALQQSHQGVSTARNLALDYVHSKFVCFIDADDSIEPDYLSSMLAYNESDMVVCGYYVDFFKDEKFQKQEIHLPDTINWSDNQKRSMLLPLFMSGMIHINCNKLLKMDIIRQHHIQYRQQPINEDYMFMLEYLQYSRSLSTVALPLYHWNRVEGGLSGVDSLPGNLLQLYNDAHLLTRVYFQESPVVADRALYYSYNYLVPKYFAANKRGVISKQVLKEKLTEFHNNNLVRASFSSYSPQSAGEYLLYILLKHGLFHTYRWLTKRLLKWKN